MINLMSCELLSLFTLLDQSLKGRIVHTGECLGAHVWDEEMLRETRGEFMFAHVRHMDFIPKFDIDILPGCSIILIYAIFISMRI